MNRFWRNWLTVWCWGTLAFGVVLAMAASPATDAAPRFAMVLISGDQATAAQMDQGIVRFAFGLMGALTIGLGLMMFALFRAAETGGARVWRDTTVAFLAWYVIDSVISVVTGFPLNAASNTLIAAAYLVPVLASGVMREDGRAVAA